MPLPVLGIGRACALNNIGHTATHMSCGCCTPRSAPRGWCGSAIGAGGGRCPARAPPSPVHESQSHPPTTLAHWCQGSNRGGQATRPASLLEVGTPTAVVAGTVSGNAVPCRSMPHMSPQSGAAVPDGPSEQAPFSCGRSALASVSTKYAHAVAEASAAARWLAPPWQHTLAAGGLALRCTYGQSLVVPSTRQAKVAQRLSSSYY